MIIFEEVWIVCQDVRGVWVTDFQQSWGIKTIQSRLCTLDSSGLFKFPRRGVNNSNWTLNINDLLLIFWQLVFLKFETKNIPPWWLPKIIYVTSNEDCYCNGASKKDHSEQPSNTFVVASPSFILLRNNQFLTTAFYTTIRKYTHRHYYSGCNSVWMAHCAWFNI